MSLQSCRSRIEAWVTSKPFVNVITAVILANAVTLGLETSHSIMAAHGNLIRAVDHVILGVFVVELILKLFALGGRFFKSGWNLFDFAVVAISLFPASGPFAVLRTLRVLRVMRLISTVPSLRRVVSALLTAIPGMTSVMSVLLVIFYVSAVMTTQIFGAVDDARMQALYGTIGDSMFTLFQIMTLEGWHEVAETTLQYFPSAWAFFVVFIVVTSFAVLNLFIGIIVDAMNILHDEAGDTLAHRDHTEEMQLLIEMKQEVKALREEIAALRK